MRTSLLALALLSLAGCAALMPPSKGTSATSTPDCEFQVLSSEPTRGFNVVETIAGAPLARTAQSLRIAVAPKVCAASADAVIAETDATGAYVRARIIRYTGD